MMAKLMEHWPNWGADIHDRMRASERNCHATDPPSMEVVIENQRTILKALWWLLHDAQSKETG